MRSREKQSRKVSVDTKAIGRRIRELRGFDTTQVDLARRLGVAQSHLSALEHGETQPCATVLLAIKREFGKSIDWLLTGEVSPPNHK
jgi:transcriptional regulator with XRE-family HTH domain